MRLFSIIAAAAMAPAAVSAFNGQSADLGQMKPNPAAYEGLPTTVYAKDYRCVVETDDKKYDCAWSYCTGWTEGANPGAGFKYYTSTKHHTISQLNAPNRTDLNPPRPGDACYNVYTGVGCAWPSWSQLVCKERTEEYHQKWYYGGAWSDSGKKCRRGRDGKYPSWCEWHVGTDRFCRAGKSGEEIEACLYGRRPPFLEPAWAGSFDGWAEDDMGTVKWCFLDEIKGIYDSERACVEFRTRA
ncbi:hypothetical protein CDD83_2811 [Cordyceps sp. RAO-2017]|nr:hypothetical protein CDD83_2811 [Cordyceps sp. RAO-2017]